MAKDTNRIMHQDELPALARSVRTGAGLTQQEAADRLGVSKPSISRAERLKGGSYLNLQQRIIEEIGGYDLRGPLWEASR